MLQTNTPLATGSRNLRPVTNLSLARGAQSTGASGGPARITDKTVELKIS
jgi:hypothetical protein